MSADTHFVNCGNCGLQLEENPSASTETRRPCPSCGSKARVIQIMASDTGKSKEKATMKGWHNEGVGRPFVERVQGDDLHRDTGIWRHLNRVIDRENNEYHEVVEDQATGEIVHECHESLSQHRVHGAAKRRSKSLKVSEP